jgi:tetratricopeptide (TPR) repeat protein
MDPHNAGTLADVISRLWRSGRPRQEEILRALRSVRSVCESLIYLHARGVIHCDLKPENIFLSSNGTPVIGDFGLAVHLGFQNRERLELDSIAAGTVAYMAPEQIRGEPLDARADLYSLGCILFELCTGRPPFQGSVRDVANQQLVETPPSILETMPDASPELAELCLGLLRKDTKLRIGAAQDVAHALDRVLGDTPTIAPEAQGARAHLFRPVMVGRDELMDEVRLAQAKARDGLGSLTLVRGESGVGKTRFAVEAARIAQMEGMQVITGECIHVAGRVPDGDASMHQKVGAGPLHPFGPLLEALGDACYTDPAFGDAALPGAVPLTPFCARLERVVQERLPRPPPASKNQHQARDAMVSAIACMARLRPLMLVLDDLQWADSLTLEVLRALSDEALSSLPLFVMATVRREHWSSLSSALVSDAATAPTVIVLPRLAPEHVTALAGDMLAVEAPPEGLTSFLVERSEGNPFFVGELLRDAVSSGVLRRTPAGGWRMLGGVDGTVWPLPRSLRELVSARIDALGALERTVLEYASLLGREFGRSTLASVLRYESESIQGALKAPIDGLIAHEILEEGSGEQLRFVHDMLREIPYQGIVEERRARLHLRVAQALERAGGPEESAGRWSAIGVHWSLGGDPTAALRSFTKAALLADRDYANEDAITLYRAAEREARRLDAPPPDALVKVLRGRGDVLARLGFHEPAQQAYEEAVQWLGTSEGLACCALHRKIAKTWENRLVVEPAYAALDRAELALRPVHEQNATQGGLALIEVLFDRAWAAYWDNDLPELERVVFKVRPIVDRHGDNGHWARYHQAQTSLGFRRDHYAMSSDTIDAATAGLLRAEAAADLDYLTAAEWMLGFALLFGGRPNEAETHLLRAADIAGRRGDARHQKLALGYLTLVHRMQGDEVAMRRRADELLRESRGGLLVVWSALAQANLGWACVRNRQFSDAERYLSEAMSFWDSMPMTYPFKWTGLLPQLEMSLLRNDSRWIIFAKALSDRGLAALPDPVSHALGCALVLHEAGRLEAAEQDAWDVVERARQAHLL